MHPLLDDLMSEDRVIRLLEYEDLPMYVGFSCKTNMFGALLDGNGWNPLRGHLLSVAKSPYYTMRSVREDNLRAPASV